MSISKLTFDFNAAAAKARDLYPAETQGLEFIDLSARGAFNKLLDNFIVKNERFQALPPEAQEEMYPTLFHQAMAYSNTPAFSHKGVLAMNPQKPENKLTSPYFDDNLGQTFIFYHELAHIIFDHAKILRDAALSFALQPDEYKQLVNTCECQADSFAAAIGLKEGWLTRDDVTTLAKSRRNLDHDMDHITDVVLEALALYSVSTFEKMSGQDIKTFAADHGKEYSPNLARINEARAVAYKRGLKP